MQPTPYFRDAGTGPGVVCLHSNASNSSQWRSLMERLSANFRVLAPDSYGAGKSPAWPKHRPLRLHDEVDLIEPVFALAGEPFVLVGHSYGAATALVAALAQPQRVSALVLYEPTVFALLDAESPPPNQADGIRAAVREAGAALDADKPTRAAEVFIDFWMGAGAWAGMPEARQSGITAQIVNVRDWAGALFGQTTPLKVYAGLPMPVLYLTGKDSPASSLGVARLLTRTLPHVERVEFDGLGHMGPITHPERVNDTIARFLETRFLARG